MAWPIFGRRDESHASMRAKVWSSDFLNKSCNTTFLPLRIPAVEDFEFFCSPTSSVSFPMNMNKPKLETIKRGRDRFTLSLHFSADDFQIRMQLANKLTPKQIFDRN